MVEGLFGTPRHKTDRDRSFGIDVFSLSDDDEDNDDADDDGEENDEKKVKRTRQ
jgi:hypothetical protein